MPTPPRDLSSSGAGNRARVPRADHDRSVAGVRTAWATWGELLIQFLILLAIISPVIMAYVWGW